MTVVAATMGNVGGSVAWMVWRRVMKKAIRRGRNEEMAKKNLLAMAK
jgi:hypothetical protein